LSAIKRVSAQHAIFHRCTGEGQVPRCSVKDGQAVQRRQALWIGLHAFEECVRFRMID